MSQESMEIGSQDLQSSSGLTDDLSTMNIDLPHNDWSAGELTIIKQHIDYHAAMLTYCNHIRVHKEQTKKKPVKPGDPFPPIKPKKRMVASRKPQTKEELNNYLKKRMGINATKIHQVSVERMGLGEDFSMILKEGHENVKANHQQGLQHALVLGECLVYAFSNYTHYKITKNIKSTWSTWLVTEVGIHKSYDKMLRHMAFLTQKYSKFKLLSISFAELYSFRKLLLVLLQSDLRNDWL